MSEPGSPSAAASLDRAAVMASATLSSSASAEGAPADSLGMPSTLDLTGFIDSYEHVSGTSHAVMSEGSGPSCGVDPSALGAVISPDGTHPLGPSAAAYPATEVPVLGTEGSASTEGAVLEAANVPDPLEIPTFGDLVDPSGQGLSTTPEGTSSSLPCGQRVATPELTYSQNSSFEVISDTDSEKRPDRQTAPASGAPGTLGGETRVDLDRPPLGFDDLFALIRSAPIENYGVVTANVRQEFRTVHDQDTLVALLMAKATARVATATEIYQQAVQRVGDGQATPTAFLELVRYLDDVRHQHVRSD